MSFLIYHTYCLQLFHSYFTALLPAVRHSTYILLIALSSLHFWLSYFCHGADLKGDVSEYKWILKMCCFIWFFKRSPCKALLKQIWYWFFHKTVVLSHYIVSHMGISIESDNKSLMSVAAYFSRCEFITFPSVSYRGQSTWDQMGSYNLWADWNALNKPAGFLRPPKEAAALLRAQQEVSWSSCGHQPVTPHAASLSWAQGGWWALCELLQRGKQVVYLGASQSIDSLTAWVTWKFRQRAVFQV